MNPTDDARSFRERLNAIANERVARNELINSRAAKELAARKEQSDRLARTAGSVAARLNERAQRIKAAGGWATSGSLSTDDVNPEMDFSIPDRDSPADEAYADTSPDPTHRAGPAHVSTTDTPISRPARGRHRASHEEDDDFAHTKWWNG